MNPPPRAYVAHGLSLFSDIALPASTEDRAETDHFDVRCRVAPSPHLPVTVHHRRPDADADPEPFVCELWTSEGLVVEFPGQATFAVSEDEIVVILDETDDPDLLAHLLLDHVLPRVIDLRGDVMLHASAAVRPDGRAEVFVGPTGSGKSTMAVALAVAGWDLVNDDGIRVVRHSPGGAWAAVPGYPDVRLLSDAAAHLLPNATAVSPMSRDSDKLRYPADGAVLRMASAPAPIAAVNVVERGNVAEPVVESLGLAAAITVIADHAFHLAADPELITRQAFEKAAALARSLPVRRLLIPDDLSQLARVATFLADLESRPLAGRSSDTTTCRDELGAWES